MHWLRLCPNCKNDTPVFYPVCFHCRKRLPPLADFDDKPCAIQRYCLRFGPWHVLVGCLLLNMTTRTQVKKVLPELFVLCPRPEDLVDVDDERLVALLTPLGLVNRRVRALCNLTDDYLNDVPLDKIRHCGPYCRDSYRVFVLNEDVPIREDMDGELKRYLLQEENK
jgi:adenine-specific DNA glycosylase